MKNLTVAAPAKLNLFLHVTGRRDDRHLLETLFVALDFGDLQFELRLADFLPAPFNVALQLRRLGEALRERDGEQEREKHLHARQRDAQLVQQLDQLAVDPLLVRLLRHGRRVAQLGRGGRVVRVELVLQLAADRGEDL